jgi:hypothetical protein
MDPPMRHGLCIGKYLWRSCRRWSALPGPTTPPGPAGQHGENRVPSTPVCSAASTCSASSGRAKITRGSAKFEDLGYRLPPSDKRRCGWRTRRTRSSRCPSTRLHSNSHRHASRFESAEGVGSQELQALKRHESLDGETSLTAAGQDVQIVIRNKPRSRPSAWIIVVAA